MNIKKGFTLAEVLIAIAVIGVIAMLVIPNFMKAQHDKDIVAKLEKSRSLLAQAEKMAETQYGSIDGWNMSQMDSKTIFQNFFQPNLKIGINCATNSSQKCWTETLAFKGQNPATGGNKYGIVGTAPVSFTLSDGMNMTLTKVSTIDEKLGVSSELPDSIIFMVDVNGDAAPNKMGQDVFAFAMTENGMIPAGSDNDSGNCQKSSELDDDYWDCSARVLSEGKREYM